MADVRALKYVSIIDNIYVSASFGSNAIKSVIRLKILSGEIVIRSLVTEYVNDALILVIDFFTA